MKSSVNRSAIVTGGTGGIGSAICQLFLDAGYSVVATALPSDTQSTQAWKQRFQHFSNAVVVHGDVSCEADCDQIVNETQSNFGRVDILVNAAGITCDRSLKNMPTTDWQTVIDINLNSVFYMCKRVSPLMCDQGWGRIIQLSSVNGLTGQFGQTNYAASKAGVIGFTMALAREVAAKGVTVNSISPGMVDTAMIKSIPKDLLEGMKKQIPIGRLAAPLEIANVVNFLASDAASYITGENISVNGGLFMQA